MVRVEHPLLGPGRLMEQVAPWETFQVLGPHSGVDICDSNSIKRWVYCGILWYTVIYCDMLWYTVIYCDILWYTVVY